MVGAEGNLMGDDLAEDPLATQAEASRTVTDSTSLCRDTLNSFMPCIESRPRRLALNVCGRLAAKEGHGMSPEEEVFKLVENEEMGEVRRQLTLRSLKVNSSSRREGCLAELARLIMRKRAEARAGELNVELPAPGGKTEEKLAYSALQMFLTIGHVCSGSQ